MTEHNPHAAKTPTGLILVGLFRPANISYVYLLSMSPKAVSAMEAVEAEPVSPSQFLATPPAVMFSGNTKP